MTRMGKLLESYFLLIRVIRAIRGYQVLAFFVSAKSVQSADSPP